MKEKPKIFIGYLDHCGHFSGLAKGFQILGLKTYFLNLGTTQYELDGQFRQRESLIPRLFKYVYKKRFSNDDQNIFIKRFYFILYYIALLSILLWICLNFDVVILNSGASLSSRELDLKLFKILKIKSVASFHGSDSRPPYMHGGYLKLPMEEVAVLTRKTKEHVRRASAYIDILVDNPLCAHFHEKRVCFYQAIGIPVAVPIEFFHQDMSYYSSADGIASDVVILHAPTHKGIKGSDVVREVIKNLKAKGYKIKYAEVTGVSREEVVKQVSMADIIIDQLYSDIHVATLTSEACLAGKPTIVCGYGGAELRRILPPKMLPPTIYVLPDEFERELENLIREPERRRILGHSAREFSEKYILPDSVSRNLLEVIQGLHSDWFYDPADVRYIGGVGALDHEIRGMLRHYVHKFGPSNLYLDDKPKLKDWIREEILIQESEQDHFTAEVMEPR